MTTAKELSSRLAAMAPASFFPSLALPSLSTPATMHTCVICTGFLDRPIELRCGNMVCLHCCMHWLTVSEREDCPCCYCSLQDHTCSPSSITMSVLGQQLVECRKGCNRTVRAEQYLMHLQSQCQAFFEYSTRSPSRVTVKDILNKDRESPTTPVEKEVATNIIRRLMVEGEDNQILHLPTRGQVIIHCT